MDVSRFLRQTVYHRPKTGEDDYNAPIFGPANQRPARVDDKHQKVVGGGGQEILSTTVVLLGPDPIAVGDQINAVDDAEGNYRDVQSIESVRDVRTNLTAWRAFL